MKKTYIKPENTVVLLNTETMIANSADPTQFFIPEKKALVEGGIVEQDVREVIQAPDAWEEW